MNLRTWHVAVIAVSACAPRSGATLLSGRAPGEVDPTGGTLPRVKTPLVAPPRYAIALPAPL
jgi:hypothetical protein